MEEKQNGSAKKKLNKKVLIGIVVGAVVLVGLALALFFATPLGQVFLAGKNAPEVTLELLSGPVPDEESGKYLFEVEAITTGSPAPEVTFNRYDHPEEFGEHRITLFLNSGESFTLIVVAKNSEGKATAELVLSAEDTDEQEDSGDITEDSEQAAENRPPVINDIIFSHDLFQTGGTYTVTADAGDPDGDALTYQWSITGGSAPDFNVNPIAWTTPGTPGDPQLTVIVRDGKGGEAVLTKQVPVGYLRLSPLASQSGQIIKDQEVRSPACIYAGDSNTNRPVRGFISFDIAKLDGLTVKTAELRLAEPKTWGNPAFMHGSLGLWVGIVRWGDRPLALSDFMLSGVGLGNYTDYGITLTSTAGQPNKRFVDEIQKNINEGNNRLQIRLHYAAEGSNSNNQWDGVEYELDNISLYLTF